LLVERKSCSGDMQTDLQLERIFCLRPASVCPSLPLELQSSVCSYGSSVRDVCYANGCVLPLARENRLAHGSQLPSQALAAWTRWACALSFPSICYAAAFSYESTVVRHFSMFALRRCVLSTLDLWKRCALAVRCGAFGTCCALAELRLISPEDGFPPLVADLALFVLRNGAGGCLRRGLHEVLSVPHRRWKSPL
jgi:hypothetical protein